MVCGCWRSNATGPVVPGAAGPWTWAPLASEPIPATAMSTESWPEGASTATTSPTAVDALAGTPSSPLRSAANTLSGPGAEATGVVRTP